MTDDFEGHAGRECGEHRTVGPVRAWCFECGEWCYPRSPCVRCERGWVRQRLETADDDPPAFVAWLRQVMS